MRIDTTPFEDDSFLAYFVRYDKVDYLKWLIALRDEDRLGFRQVSYRQALDAAGKLQNQTARLLADYEADHQASHQVSTNTTKFRVSPELGLVQHYIADIYATIIFLCDGLLQFPLQHQDENPNEESPTQARVIRYFNIASQLPMEIQMLICHRTFNSAANNILTSEAELGFRRLANSLLLADNHRSANQLTGWLTN